MLHTIPKLLSGLLFAHVTFHACFQAGAHHTDKPMLLPSTVTPNAWKMALHDTMLIFKVCHVVHPLHSTLHNACRPVQPQGYGLREGGCASQPSDTTQQSSQRHGS